VSNLTFAPEAVYAVYRQRGDVENRYKELKDNLGLGRTGCPWFLANQFRVLLTATAYIPVPGAAAARPGHGLRGSSGRVGNARQRRPARPPVAAPARRMGRVSPQAATGRRPSKGSPVSPQVEVPLTNSRGVRLTP
jgi:hypothetical protein